MMKKRLNQYLIFFAAILIMFLPRRFYIAGIYSFRAIILGIFILYVLSHKSIVYPRILRSIPVILYLGYSFLNYVFSSQLTSGIGFLVDTVIMICLLVSLIKDRQNFIFFIDCFIGMLAIYDVFGIVETFTGLNVYDLISGSSAINSVRFGLTRFCGAGLVSSNNANFLLLASILVLYRILHCDSSRQQRKLIVVYVLNAIALFCTLTRAPIMLFFALQVIWLLKAGMFRFVWRYFVQILTAVIITVAIVAFVPQIHELVTNFFAMFQALFDSATADSISSSFGSNAEGIGERLQLYEWVANQIKGSEVFGKGANTPFIQEWTTSYGRRVIKNSLENHYLMVYYQFGAVGLVTFLLHYLYLLIVSVKDGKACAYELASDPLAKWNFSTMVSWGIIIMIPAMFVTGLFDELRMLYLMVALSVAYSKLDMEEMETLQVAV